MHPTRTINRIHFEDLDPSRFEDLCLMMVYRLNRWDEINHYGRSGADSGIDIYAKERLDNSAVRNWYIQCKRYKRLSKKDIQDVIEQLVQCNCQRPDILLLIVSCDLRKETIDYYKTYAMSKGIPHPIIWTSSYLEAKLYSEYHDLLFAYFGVSLSSERRAKVATIRRNIFLKKKMRNDFLKKHINPKETLKRPMEKFDCAEIIVHSIDDNSYPNSDENSVGISGWFKVEPYNFYFNGIQVILTVREIIMDNNCFWDIVQYGEKRNGKYTSFKAWEIGYIPYENVVDYDIDGDDYYNSPHIYCDFRNNGMPYEKIGHYAIRKTETDYDYKLDEAMRKKLL